MNEILQLEALAEAVQDSKIAASAVIDLREQFRRLGCEVELDWSPAIAAARAVEIEYLALYECIKECIKGKSAELRKMTHPFIRQRSLRARSARQIQVCGNSGA